MVVLLFSGITWGLIVYLDKTDKMWHMPIPGSTETVDQVNPFIEPLLPYLEILEPYVTRLLITSFFITVSLFFIIRYARSN